MRTSYDGLSFDLPEGWFDITDDLPEGSPLTLGRPNGLGVIQFSVTRYAGGALPDITIEILRPLLEIFCEQNGLNSAGISTQKGRMASLTADGHTDEDFLAVWYLTNSLDVVLVTYVALVDDTVEIESELRDAVRLTQSIEYARPSA